MTPGNQFGKRNRAWAMITPIRLGEIVRTLLRGCPWGCRLVIKVSVTVTAQAAMLVRMEMAAMAMATAQAALQMAMPTLWGCPRL